MKRIIKRALLVLSAALILAAATGCEGDIDAAHNCDWVRAVHIEDGQLPTKGDPAWVVWDASYSWIDASHQIEYHCRVLSLSYGFATFTAIENPDNGTDSDYWYSSASLDGWYRSQLPGQRHVMCEGHRMSPPALTCPVY